MKNTKGVIFICQGYIVVAVGQVERRLKTQRNSLL